MRRSGAGDCRVGIDCRQVYYPQPMTTDSAPAPAGESPQASTPARPRNVAVWLKRGAAGAVALVVAGVLGAYFLPREPEVTRSIDIAIPRAAVFRMVADLRHLPDWLPLLAADPNAAITYTGPLDGVGQTVRWQSKLPAVGSGAETVTAIKPGREVEIDVRRVGKPPVTSWFRLTEKGPSVTTVVWGYRKDVGFNPVNRYRSLAIDGVVGPVYERGLKRLKAVAETPAKSN
jgi:hypothetical protein